MTLPIASRTRQALRQDIGYNLGSVYVGVATSAGTNATIIDARLRGGTDDHKGKEIIMVSGTAGNIGEKAKVTSYDPTTTKLTFTPVLSGATATDDGYEMHEGYSIDEIANKINQAIASVADDVLKDKEDHSLYKEANKYENIIPSGFVAIHTVEYEYETKIDELIHDCETVWDELVDTDVTASLDTTYEKVGTGCLKLVVAAGCAAGDILATEDISSLDISECDEVVAWIWSSVALTAGDIQILLDNTALCASPVESLDIPAVSANTWTRVTITLANPTSDNAIISVGLKMVVDKGAFTLRADDIRAQNSKSRIFRMLNPDMWGIIQATTNLLKLTEAGYSAIGNNSMLRLSGYKIPSELSSDSATCEVDPDFVVARATAYLLMGKAKAREIDPEDRRARATWWMGISEVRLGQASTSLENNTRWVS